MPQPSIIEELKKTQSLLLREKQEDLQQYKFLMAGTSLHERRKQGILWYPVGIEKTRFDSGERLLVKVSRPREHTEGHSFQSGKLVSLFMNNGQKGEERFSVNGVVNQVWESEMLLTLNADGMPDWIKDGKLGVQLLFDENSYLEMERAMRLVIEPNDERLARLRSVLLGDAEASFSGVHEITSQRLNPGQNKAMNNVLAAEDVAIVHGPPGTGKTTTLVETIAQTLKTEPQVLVCAPSNAAIDLVVEKLHSTGINVVRIGHPARVTQENLDRTLDAQTARHLSFKDLRMVKRRAEEVRDIALKFKRSFGPEEREQRRLLLDEADALKKEASQLQFYITGDILSKAQVIATTLVGAANPVIRDRKYGTVFIDEAAQALEPATWIPITKARRVVFAGDHCQLPPTIKSVQAAKEGLEATLFEKAIQRNHADVMLKEQYRMNIPIMAFSSRYFYKGELEANPSVAAWKIFPGDFPVEFIDTAGCGFFEKREGDGHSICNPEEAQLLVKHFTQYLETALLNGCTGAGTIGIISPYKAQTVLLKEMLNGSALEEENSLSINTVDSFQGQERDVIYISLVRSNEKGTIGFLNDIRRMNVAMTRARKKLVVIGDSATMGNHPFYGSLLDYFGEIGAYRSAFELG
ncbi:MAG: AAA domain-containing protein [Breznakibacter sp.]